MTVAFAAIGFVTSTVAAPADGVAGGDWPTYRHDAALSAVSPLKGGLGQPPRVAWSVDLGGPANPLRIGPDSRRHRGRPRRDPDPRQRHGRMPGRDRTSALEARGLFRSLRSSISATMPATASRGILLTTTVGGRVETFMIDGRSGRLDPPLEGREQLRRTHPVREAAGGRRRGAGRQHLQRANPAGTARGEHPARQLRARPRSTPFPHPQVPARRLLFTAHALRRPRCRRRRGDGRDQP